MQTIQAKTTRQSLRATIRRAALALSATAWGLGGEALAALPSPQLPTGASDSDNWLEMLKGYVKDGASVLALVISVGVFFLLAYNVAADLMAVRKGDKEWGDMGFGAVIGAAFFLWISWLMSKATAII